MYYCYVIRVTSFSTFPLLSLLSWYFRLMTRSEAIQKLLEDSAQASVSSYASDSHDSATEDTGDDFEAEASSGNVACSRQPEPTTMNPQSAATFYGNTSRRRAVATLPASSKTAVHAVLQDPPLSTIVEEVHTGQRILSTLETLVNTVVEVKNEVRVLQQKFEKRDKSLDKLFVSAFEAGREEGASATTSNDTNKARLKASDKSITSHSAQAEATYQPRKSQKETTGDAPPVSIPETAHRKTLSNADNLHLGSSLEEILRASEGDNPHPRFRGVQTDEPYPLPGTPRSTSVIADNSRSPHKISVVRIETDSRRTSVKQLNSSSALKRKHESSGQEQVSTAVVGTSAEQQQHTAEQQTQSDDTDQQPGATIPQSKLVDVDATLSTDVFQIPKYEGLTPVLQHHLRNYQSLKFKPQEKERLTCNLQLAYFHHILAVCDASSMSQSVAARAVFHTGCRDGMWTKTEGGQKNGTLCKMNIERYLTKKVASIYRKRSSLTQRQVQTVKPMGTRGEYDKVSFTMTSYMCWSMCRFQV